MTYQVKFPMQPDGPYVDREADTLIQQYKSGEIKADTMVRLQEWDTWIPIATALNLSPQKGTNHASTNPVLKCPKCGGEMHEGFIVELGELNIVTVSRWVAGTPEESLWFGLNLQEKAQYAVQTFRCSLCGFLESYARERLTT